jgi:hypothetical protein
MSQNGEKREGVKFVTGDEGGGGEIEQISCAGLGSVEQLNEKKARTERGTETK